MPTTRVVFDPLTRKPPLAFESGDAKLLCKPSNRIGWTRKPALLQLVDELQRSNKIGGVYMLVRTCEMCLTDRKRRSYPAAYEKYYKLDTANLETGGILEGTLGTYYPAASLIHLHIESGTPLTHSWSHFKRNTTSGRGPWKTHF